jgi:methenyltetrahydromethanopterin cyclohydrolase
MSAESNVVRPLSSAQASVNQLTLPLVEEMIRQRDALRVSMNVLPSGARVVDAGIAVPGGLEAGRLVAEICMGGLGKVDLVTTNGRWPMLVSVSARNPVLACLGSQYAGWSLSHGEGKAAFHALGSGPGRALSRKEPLFEELGYQDSSDATCLVLEVDRVPPQEIIDKVSRDCRVAPESSDLHPDADAQSCRMRANCRPRARGRLAQVARPALSTRSDCRWRRLRARSTPCTGFCAGDGPYQ